MTLATLKQLTDNVETIDNYPSFSQAITSIGATVTTLIINQNVNVTANETVPSTLSLLMVGQGQFTISSSVTLTLNGPFEAELRQLFVGAGTATFGAGAISFIEAEWYASFATAVSNNPTIAQAIRINSSQIVS